MDGPPLTGAALLGLQGSRDEEQSGTMTIAVLGIDLGKNSCSLVGLDVSGAGSCWGADACGARRGDRLWARSWAGVRRGYGGVLWRSPHGPRPGEKKGHTVRLMSPEFVRPYVKTQKNDDRDARCMVPGCGVTG